MRHFANGSDVPTCTDKIKIFLIASYPIIQIEKLGIHLLLFEPSNFNLHKAYSLLNVLKWWSTLTNWHGFKPKRLSDFLKKHLLFWWSGNNHDNDMPPRTRFKDCKTFFLYLQPWTRAELTCLGLVCACMCLRRSTNSVPVGHFDHIPTQK